MLPPVQPRKGPLAQPLAIHLPQQAISEGWAMGTEG